jgi:hypothetical protein
MDFEIDFQFCKDEVVGCEACDVFVGGWRKPAKAIIIEGIRRKSTLT